MCLNLVHKCACPVHSFLSLFANSNWCTPGFLTFFKKMRTLKNYELYQYYYFPQWVSALNCCRPAHRGTNLLFYITVLLILKEDYYNMNIFSVCSVMTTHRSREWSAAVNVRSIKGWANASDYQSTCWKLLPWHMSVCQLSVNRIWLFNVVTWWLQ